MNLLGGTLASLAAGQSADLISDFRVGFLLRTPPKLQFAAQAVGTIFASFIAPGAFVLFSTAYPCIIDASAVTCPFQAPNIQAWRAVAVAMTSPALPIPLSSVIFSVIFSLVGAASVIVKQYLWTGKWEWVRKYQPSFMAIAMAFVLPATVYSTAMVIGAVIAFVWARKSKRTWELYGHACAAGLMSGEGIGGVLNAGLVTIGLDGTRLGTQIGCPGGQC